MHIFTTFCHQMSLNYVCRDSKVTFYVLMKQKDLFSNYYQEQTNELCFNNAQKNIPCPKNLTMIEVLQLPKCIRSRFLSMIRSSSFFLSMPKGQGERKKKLCTKFPFFYRIKKEGMCKKIFVIFASAVHSYYRQQSTS